MSESSPTTRPSVTLTGSSSQTKDGHTSIPTTPARSSKRRRISQSQSEVSIQLSHIGLKLDDPAYDEATIFPDHIDMIVSSKRESTMKPASVKKYRKYYKAYKGSNESTFLYNMFPLMLGEGYHVPMEKPNSEELPNHEEEHRVWKHFLMDEGIFSAANSGFKKLSFLGTFSDSPNLEARIVKDLAKDAGMTTPRPDFAFGMASQQFPFSAQVVLPQDIWDLLHIIPEMQFPFLIVEGKAASEDTLKAENQARRGGATLIKASRLLRKEVEEREGPILPGDAIGEDAVKSKQPLRVTPDYGSFLFSVVLALTNFDVYVHWFDESTGYYHMKFVDSIPI